MHNHGTEEIELHFLTSNLCSQMVNDIRFLDWQVSRFASPVHDLHHLIFTSTDKSLRDREYKNLLDHYYHTLTGSIKDMGSDTDLFCRQRFDEQLDKFGPWAIIISVFTMLFIFADADNLFDSDATFECMDKRRNPLFIPGMWNETWNHFDKFLTRNLSILNEVTGE